MAARRSSAEPDELLRWVALHEITHALQFGGVPWLRAAPRRRWCASCSAALEVDPRGCCSMPDTSDLRSLVDKRPRGRPRHADRRPRAPRARSTAMQAFMAVLEGYAEHVMDAVGAESSPTCRSCAARWTAAAATAPACCGCFEQLIGMDLKLRQYEQGKKFCDARRRARRDRGAQPRLGRARRRCRRSPSSTTRTRGWRARAPRAAA